MTRCGDALAAAERLGDLGGGWTDSLLVVRVDATVVERARALLTRDGSAAAV